MTALELVDRALVGLGSDARALVTGTLPPAGRDLDLQLAPGALAAVAAALRREGFRRRGSTWARFAPLELVDLQPLADPDMLSRAEPVAGCERVCRPDPADALRLTARDHAADGRLTDGRRARAAVPEEVWAQARRRGDAAHLDHLARTVRGERLERPLPARALGRYRRVRQAGVVALSGVDGAGKSTQATRLCETLAAAGFDVAAEWSRLSHDAVLTALAAPVKAVLRRVRPHGAAAAGDATSGVASDGGDGGDGGGAVTDGRGAGGLVGQVWVLVVAMANVWSHQRAVRRHTLAGRVVVCDRYVLDSVVHLEAHYPPGPGRTLAAALVRWLSPRPRAAFYLALPAEVALARKSDPTTDARVATQAAGYDAAYRRLGVVRVDATEPPDRLAATIAEVAWSRL